LFFIDKQPCAAAAVSAHQMEQAWACHRRLGHLGFGTLAGLSRQGLLGDSELTPAALLQARKQHVCEPCAMGKMRRVSHPQRVQRPVRLLHRLHMDLCDLPQGYFGTVIDEATRFACVSILQRKSDAASEIRRLVAWCETQTDCRVQRVRHDRGGEYMGGELLKFYGERGIQREPTAGYSPEANGLAERHNLTLLDMALPMLADSGDARHGLQPLGDRYADHAILYANDLHNATPASGAQTGRTPHEGFLGREATLGVFRRFGCRVYVHVPGKPYAHRPKYAARGRPGRFLGFEAPFGSGIYKVLLDDGTVTRSQTVMFDDVPPPPVLGPLPQDAPPTGGGGGHVDDGCDDGSWPAAGGPLPVVDGDAEQPAVHVPGAVPELVADEPEVFKLQKR
jgi:transposase InsO family protein